MNYEDLQPAPNEPAGELMWVAGGDIDQVRVTLRILGDGLNPDDVSSLLNCRPTKSQRSGGTLPSTKCKRVASTGGWWLSISTDDGGSLEEKIGRLLDQVSSDPIAWSKLSVYRCEVFCGLFLNRWNRGCSISPDLMCMLSNRGLTLDLDIYCNGDDEVSDSSIAFSPPRDQRDSVIP